MPTIFSRIRVLPSADFGADGVPFHSPSPGTGLALVGLSIRAGEWIDQVAPIFAELLEDGSLGSEIFGAAYGGHGGSPRELHARPGHVVIGLQTRSGAYVDAIRLLEARWDGSTIVTAEKGWTSWVGGRGGVERPERLLEPTGNTVAIGIAGTSGAYVETLTLVGGEVLHIAGSAGAAQTTGRSSRTVTG